MFIALPRVPEFAVDGDNNTKYHSEVSDTYPQPWLLVNLLGGMTVKAVRILPFVGGFSGRVTLIRVSQPYESRSGTKFIA
jgi:hypothetical protein